MRFRLAIILTFLTTSAFAVVPQFWRVRSTEDFLAGEVDGFAVTSRGELRPAPAVKKIASFTDPFVLSQATAPNGDRYFGTGNDGKVYRLRGNDLKLVWTAPEPEIYTIAWHDGALYAGTSPNGKIYRVDADAGKATPLFDPKAAYIWAIDFSGNDLLAATGVEGKLFRVAPNGEGKVLFDAPDTHLRARAVRQDGRFLAGASGKGRIYEVHPDGGAHALFDSSLRVIVALCVDAHNVGWCGGACQVL